MKMISNTKMILLLLLQQQQICVPAQVASVFSKYNYYTLENNATIIAELFPGNDIKEYAFTIFKNGKVTGGSVIEQDRLIKIELPLQDFEFGKTELPYSIWKKGAVVQNGNIKIVRLQPKANEVKIDLQTGGLVADGLPFFPFGFYCNSVGRLPEQEVTHGFNLIAPYQSNLATTLAEREDYMDRCAQLGMKVQYSINSLVGTGHNGAKGLNMSDEEKINILKNEVIAFRDHPALLSWYLNDEPDGQSRPPALLEKAYQLVHELDPYHPVSIVFMLPSKFYLYRNCMDIAMTDPYPVPGPLKIVEDFVQQLNKDFRHEKSIWLVPQAFGGQEMWEREPTAKEIRLMTYIGLINNAKGIQYYTHALGNLNPQSVSAWSVCSDIAAEVNQAAAFLLSGERSVTLNTGDTNVIARSFSQEGNQLIMVANKDNKPKTIHISPEKAFTDPTAILWFENREINVSNGMIDDFIDALGTRAYLIKKEKKISATKSYPGNLTANPSFEEIVNPGLPIGSNVKKSFPVKTEAGASFFVDPQQKVDGLFSLRLITPSDSCGTRIRLLPIVIKAKNSYKVSIWAKAKPQAKLPVFRLNIEGPGQERNFKLTTDWQQYSFMFRSDSSFSAAIVGFDLITAGTAWFDMVQVTPDPLISYTISKQNKAIISVATTDSNNQVHYSLGDNFTGKQNLYAQPIIVNTSTTVTATLLHDNKQVGSAALFIPVNKALGKPVMLQSTYAPQYSASGANSLTDGLMGTTAFRDNKWLGFSGKDMVATIDMQQLANIHSVTIHFLCDPNSGIFLPPKVSVYTSNDGNNFRFSGSFLNSIAQKMGEPFLQSFIIKKNSKARYIKIVADTFGDIPEGYLFKGTKSWIFIDEIMIN